MGLKYSRTMIVPKCKLYEKHFQSLKNICFTTYSKKDDKWYYYVDPINPMGKTKYIYKN